MPATPDGYGSGWSAEEFALSVYPETEATTLFQHRITDVNIDNEIPKAGRIDRHQKIAGSKPRCLTAVVAEALIMFSVSTTSSIKCVS